MDGDAKYDRLYLNQYTIANFLLQPKGDKRKQIANIVGFEDIVNVKAIISSVLGELQRSPRFRDLQTRLQYNQGQLTAEIYGEPVSTYEGLFEHSKKLLAKFSMKDEIDSLESLDKAIAKALETLPSPDRAKEKVGLESLKKDVSERAQRSNYSAVLFSWISSYENLVKDKDKLAKINLYEFLNQAEKVLEHDCTISRCPLCEQEIEGGEKLLQSVISRYKHLAELREKLQKMQAELRGIITSIQGAASQCQMLKQRLADKKIVFDEAAFDSYATQAQGISAALQDSFSKKEGIPYDKSAITQTIQKLIEEFKRIGLVIDTEIPKLSFSEEERQKQETYTKLTRGKQLVIENIQMAKEIEAFKNQIKDMGLVEEQMLKLQNDTIRKVLDLISEDVNRLFFKLNKKEGLKEARLELVGEEGIEFSLLFYDRKAIPPRKYLSESQINSLGIAFFLAAVKRFNRTNRFFVLDDILLSFDKNYRIRLLDILQEEFGDYQIILLTHEEYWFELIKKKFPEWIFKKVSWTFETGINFKDSKLDGLDEIKAKHSKGEKVGNELRVYLEDFLKDICISLDVRLPFRLGLDNEQRMVGELFPALSSTLKDHRSSLRESVEYKDMEISGVVANIISHHNPDLASFGDTDETIGKIEKFRDLFRCKNGRMIQKDVIVPGKKMISCKCGCLEVEWH